MANQFEGYPLLVTDAVLLEIGNALAHNYKKEAVAIIEHFINSNEVKIAHMTPQLFSRAFAEYKKYQDKEWGLIDCVSFIVMLLRIVEILCFIKIKIDRERYQEFFDD